MCSTIDDAKIERSMLICRTLEERDIEGAKLLAKLFVEEDDFEEAEYWVERAKKWSDEDWAYDESINN